jgi:hypothetical protein
VIGKYNNIIRMVLYTLKNLAKRHKIIQSQILFGNFLDSHIINKLINLFDKYNKSNESIVKYVENERILRKYNSNIEIKSEVYNIDENKPTLHLQIIKNNIDFIHLSIHLITNELKPKDNGIIHFKKDIYKKLYNTANKLLYTLISVSKPSNKPNSLEFSIADGYNTPSNVKNTEIYDLDLQREMDAIISVLNHLFDETNTEFYIGDPNKLHSIHRNTNRVLTNINKDSKHTIRKNKGIKMLPNYASNIPFSISKNKKVSIKLSKRPTRKIYKLV